MQEWTGLRSWPARGRRAGTGGCADPWNACLREALEASSNITRIGRVGCR